jgi:hypothetical protein
MAKKDKNDDEAAGDPEVKLTAVTTLLPDPNDVKHNPNLLVETLRKAPARNHPRARSDAALFLWDLSLNDPDARVRMCTEEFAGACQVALRDGDVVDRSATASLVREASGWAEARPLVAAAGGLVERLCDLLDDRHVAESAKPPGRLNDTGTSSKKRGGHASAEMSARSARQSRQSDTAAARAAAAHALRELTSTCELRRLAAPTPVKGKPPRVRLDVLVRAASIAPDAAKRAAETPDAWRTRTACLETLHQCMDPARNKDARRARADAFGDASDASDAALASALAVFSEALVCADAPPEARRAAAWCLAHGTHDEHRRDLVLADPVACLALRRALRRENGDLATRAGVAAAVANLAGVSSSVSSSARADDGEAAGGDDAALGSSALEESRSLRARARALEGRLGALKKIPKDELKPADAEEKNACVAELKKMARVFAGELVGALSPAERAAARLARRRAEQTLERTNPLGPLCRLIAPPGENPGDASDDDADDAGTVRARRDDDSGGDDDRRPFASVASSPGVIERTVSDAIDGSHGETRTETDDAGTADATGVPDATSAKADGDGETNAVLDAASANAGVVPVANAAGAEDADAEAGASITEGDDSKAPNQPNNLVVGQAEAIAAAATALRRLTAHPDARAAAKLVSLRAHERLLWHLAHSKDVATRRDCRETLRQLARDAAAKAAIQAVPDAPALASRAFENADAAAVSERGDVRGDENAARLDALVPGLVAASARRRPAEEIRAKRAAEYRARGTGVREAQAV